MHVSSHHNHTLSFEGLLVFVRLLSMFALDQIKTKQRDKNFHISIRLICSHSFHEY